MANSKFAYVSDEDMQALLNTKDSVNTQRVIKRSVAVFREFLTQKSLDPEFEEYPKSELNSALRRFFASIRCKTGDNVKTSTLNTYKYGICKYLKEKCSTDVVKDSDFQSCLDLFKAKVIDLKKSGHGSVDHKPPIAEHDLQVLYRADNVALNINTPSGLQSKVWFDIMFYLCRRGQENLRDMTKSTFRVGRDPSGLEYVHQVVDEADKNHGSATTPDDTIGEGRMYACPESQLCPVRSFKKYLTKPHPKLDALWQRPREFYDDDDSVWYYNSPAGKHTLSQMMASISKKSKLSKLYTNHSIRATTITSLDHAGFEARHIMRTSGHKSEASIRSYSSRLSESKKREISSTLSRALCDQSVKSGESSVAGNHIPELSEQELMEVFSDENMFVQVDGNRQATATATDDDTTTPQNPQTLLPHLQNPVQNGGHQPFNQLSVHNTCNTNLTCGGQGVNPFLRNLQYSINPTCNNSTIHFHFYGKQ